MSSGKPERGPTGAGNLARCAAEYRCDVVHLRIVVPPGRTQETLAALESCASVVNVILLEAAARKPAGDVILCDVAREDASVVLSDLRRLGIDESGSIAVHDVDASLSRAADAAEASAEGDPEDAVIWEEVTAKTSESSRLSWSFALFIVLAALIAAVGIYLDSEILIVGAMVVGPEFGPVAGFCVAAVEKRPRLAAQSFAALAVGLPLATVAVIALSLVLKGTGATPATFTSADHSLSRTIASPDVFAVIVALCAGIAGMMSLSTAKSGALVGVLISVTTIPAAANVGVAATYGDDEAFWGSLGQLGINVAALLAAGTATLYVQRLLYLRRRGEHRARARPGERPGGPRPAAALATEPALVREPAGRRR